ncbi:hypothetical protein [Aeromonas salmonicida]|uniref:hypothetical protein n=1 Tax=Aeromonas salmonicida TaxID=645 RepID=UPI002330DC55|nr:hypothetical protein [Aeromonas salmonicida]WCH24096.1 hypothetical protein ONZ54_07120 [Aeromonas salmonicida]
MQRYNSTFEQFNTAKEAANATYFTKLLEPVQELLAFGYGYKALASALNAKGLLTQRGKPCSGLIIPDTILGGTVATMT